MDHLALEHPRFSPTNRSSEDLDVAMSAAAHLLAAMPAPGPPGWPGGEGPLAGARGRSKQESMNARLAAGEHPWDMISLKAAIQAARPGGLIVSASQSISCGEAMQSCAQFCPAKSGRRCKHTTARVKAQCTGGIEHDRADSIVNATLQSQASAIASASCMKRLSAGPALLQGRATSPA